ncbi:cellulase family glycosylhydrolase [bacterium]|nr:cellulase family glycosylhydrolase [bacterium]
MNRVCFLKLEFIFLISLNYLALGHPNLPEPWLYVEGKFIKNWEGKPFILGAIGTIWQGELYAPENPPTIPIAEIAIEKPPTKPLKQGESWRESIWKLAGEPPEIRVEELKDSSKGKIVKMKGETGQWSFFTLRLPFFLAPGKYELKIRYLSPKDGSSATGIYLNIITTHLPLTYSLPDYKDGSFHIFRQVFTISDEVRELVIKKTDSSPKDGTPLDWIEIRAISIENMKPFPPIRIKACKELVQGNPHLELIRKNDVDAISIKSEAGAYSFFTLPFPSPLKAGEYLLTVKYFGDPQRTGTITLYTDEEGEHRELLGLPHKLDGKLHSLKIPFKVNKSCNGIVFKKTGGIPYERKLWNDDFDSLLRFFKEEGLNAVRIAVYSYFDELGDAKLKELGGFEGFIIKTIDPLVQACKRNRMYAIIDLHAYPQSDPERNPMDILYNWFIPFWKAVAKVYKEEGWVAGYELWNEPGEISAKELRKWYRECIKAIRKIDPRHIIIVSDANAGWGGTKLTWKEVNFDTGDPQRQVVFTLHGGVGPNGLKDVDFLCHISDKWNVPIMLGEWECDGEWGDSEEEREKGREIFQEILNRLKACRSKHAHSFMIWRAHKPPAYIQFWAPFAIEYCGKVTNDDPPKLLIISDEQSEFIPILKKLNIPFQHATSLTAIKNLENYSALIICSLNYPQPNILNEEIERKIKEFLSKGGRAFIEYSSSYRNELFGIKLDNPRRMLSERLIVSRSHYLTKGFEEGTLLEEHNSSYLPPRNLQGETILEYGKVLGTYRLLLTKDWVELILDLGEIQTLSLFRQRYGASISDYCPEKVEIYLSEDGKDYQLVGERTGNLLPQIVEIPLSNRKGRFIKLKIYKYKRSPTTDWLFLGEMEVLNEKGENIALHKPYTLSPNPSFLYPDGYPPKLTDGIIEGHYSDKLSIGFTTPTSPSPRSPALINLSFGQGELILSLLKISDYKARFFRPTEKWENLLRNIVLYLLPPEERKKVEENYIPLKASTEPHRWILPGETARLTVGTIPGIYPKAMIENRVIPLKENSPGVWEGNFEIEKEGVYELIVRANNGKNTRELKMKIEVKEREKKYREVLDKNIQWFLKSGVMPKPDGSQGVYNQRCLAWFDGGPLESLPSPYRVDCNAKSALAFYLYGELTNNKRYKMIGENILDFMLPHQIIDPKRPSFGGFPWLYEKINTIYLWDDNTRTALCLLYLYKKTGQIKFLLPALRVIELCRRVSHPDGLITRTAVEPEELDRIGCSAYKQFQQGIASDFDLLRWFSAYAVTADEEYKKLAETCLRCWKHLSTVRGLPIAYFYTKDENIKEIIINFWRSYLEHPDVKRWGVYRVDAPDFALAFEGDCSITTEADDPLSDQLYQTSFLLLHAWWSYKATGEPVCLEAFHKIGDFLARIQMESNDERIDGAWVRGWDLESWECYGAPYDPNYGPYSAYTGWMNSIIDIAYSLYLMNENPFPELSDDKTAKELLKKVRGETPKESIGEDNIALHCRYTLKPAPVGKYADSPVGKLTDGIIDGHYEDGLSVGWHIPQGESIEVEMNLDLGAKRNIAMIAQRYGAGMNDYIPNEVTVQASEDGLNFSDIVKGTPQQAGFLFLPLPKPVSARYLKFILKKRCLSPTQDFLFAGETLVYEAR